MDLNKYSAEQLVSLAPILLLSSLKHLYDIGEGVIVTVALANLTQQPLVINKRLQMIFDYKYREAYELKFEVTGPDEKLIKPRMIIEDRLQPHPKSSDFVNLSAGSQWQQEVLLSRYFNFTKSGLYRIVTEYHNSHDGQQFGFNAWVGELHSQPVDIFIGE
jgi:hypothetical protein